MRLPESHSSSWGESPITAPHCAPMRSAMVMPTVQPSWRAWATIWSVVCLDFGRRIFGMASISSTVSKSFMPIGIDRRCRYWLSPLTIASQSYVSVVMAASCRGGSSCSGMGAVSTPRPFGPARPGRDLPRECLQVGQAGRGGRVDHLGSHSGVPVRDDVAQPHRAYKRLTDGPRDDAAVPEPLEGPERRGRRPALVRDHVARDICT